MITFIRISFKSQTKFTKNDLKIIAKIKNRTPIPITFTVNNINNKKVSNIEIKTNNDSDSELCIETKNVKPVCNSNKVIERKKWIMGDDGKIIYDKNIQMKNETMDNFEIILYDDYDYDQTNLEQIDIDKGVDILPATECEKQNDDDSKESQLSQYTDNSEKW
eukprot:230093_1